MSALNNKAREADEALADSFVKVLREQLRVIEGMQLKVDNGIMEKALSGAKSIELEAEKGFNFSNTRTKQKYYTHRRHPRHRQRVRQKIRVIPDAPDRQKEIRRKKLETYLSDLRAIHQPEESIDIIEDFIENFKPQNTEEEMMASSIWKQLDRVKEMRENGNR